MSANDTSLCPLCGGPNECQLCTLAAYKGACWCARVEIPDALIARVPEELRNRTCICPRCVKDFHRQKTAHSLQPVCAGDFYFDSAGRMAFTEAYHLRRGYCCDNGCRHCPYPQTARVTTR